MCRRDPVAASAYGGLATGYCRAGLQPAAGGMPKAATGGRRHVLATAWRRFAWAPILGIVDVARADPLNPPLARGEKYCRTFLDEAPATRECVTKASRLVADGADSARHG